MNETNDPKATTKLEKAVEDVLVENNLQVVLYFSKIQKHWDILVGEPLAAKTSPSRLVRKTLYVRVEDAAYSHHLAYFEKNIIDLIASPEICGEGAVEKICFRVENNQGAKTAESAQHNEPGKRVSGTNEISDKVKKTAEAITDKKLKNVFARFMSLKTNSKDEREK